MIQFLSIIFFYFFNFWGGFQKFPYLCHPVSGMMKDCHSIARRRQKWVSCPATTNTGGTRVVQQKSIHLFKVKCLNKGRAVLHNVKSIQVEPEVDDTERYVLLRTRKVPASNPETGYSDRGSLRFFSATSGLQIRPRPHPSAASLSPLFHAVLSSTQSRTPDSCSMTSSFFFFFVLGKGPSTSSSEDNNTGTTQTNSKYERWSIHLRRHKSPKKLTKSVL